jgi:excisionase family DNA binding protein
MSKGGPALRRTAGRNAVQEGAMSKNSLMTIEEIANNVAAAAARATESLREVSSAIAELREAEGMLKLLAASQTIAVEEDRKPSKDQNPRLVYTVPELAWKLGIHRRTIERRIKDGTLMSTNVLGRRLVTAESVRAMFETGE